MTDPDPDSGRGPDGRSRRIRGLADKTPPDQTARQLDFTGAQDGSDGNGGDDDKFPPDCDPKTLFKKLFDDTLMARIVNCTNKRVALLKHLRAIPNMEESPIKDDLLQKYAALLKRPPFVKPHQDWPPKVDDWKRLEADELEVWLGVILYIGLHPRPKLSDYWSSDIKVGAFGGRFGDITGMARDRFDEIKARLALQTYEEEEAARAVDARDCKIRNWLELVEKQCLKMYPVDELDVQLSLDEQTIKCKSKWTSLTYANRNKPAGQGYRVYSINNVRYGYHLVHKLDKPGQPNPGKIRELVLSLISRLPRFQDDSKVFHIYMDNLFTSVNTFVDILARFKHRCCGTWVNRGRIANAVIPRELGSKKDNNASPGEIRGPLYADRGELGAISWVDSSFCCFLSNIPSHFDTTVHGEGITEVGRSKARDRETGRPGTGKAPVKAPTAGVMYNKYMFATDKCDQMRGTYSAMRRGKKPWKRLFSWSLDIFTLNAWGLYQVKMDKLKMANPELKMADRQQFHTHLIWSLLGVNPGGRNEEKLKAAQSDRDSSARAPSRNTTRSSHNDGRSGSGTDDQTPGLNRIQMQELTPERQRIVRTCMAHMKVSGRKDGRRGVCKGCKSKKVKPFCEECKLHLCQRCWEPWHKEKVFGIK